MGESRMMVSECRISYYGDKMVWNEIMPVVAHFVTILKPLNCTL